MRHFLTYTFVLLLVMLAWSCTEEKTLDGLAIEGEDIQIQVLMDLPSEEMLRSLNGDDTGDEIFIETIDILAFVKYEDDKFRYVYPATNIEFNTLGNGREITATVKKYESAQIFLVICNASEEIANSGIRVNDDMDNVIKKLKCGGNTAGEWKAKINGSSEFDPFPMYTKTTEQSVSEDNTVLGPFPLVRMIARADVTLHSNIKNFKLVNACVYNRAVYGYIPYDYSGWNSTLTQVAYAGVPSENDFVGRPSILRPTVVYNAEIITDSRGSIQRSIYLFESKGVSEQDRLKGTALVVGGKYNGSDRVTYYRIDIKTAAAPTGYISQDILRNHWYQIEIQNVEGEGYDDPDDAYIGYNMLTAKVASWNYATQKVIADSQYQLKVSKDYISLSPLNGKEEIEIETNYNTTSQGYPSGIQVSESEIEYISGGAGWLTLSGGANGDLLRTICITAGTNDDPSARKAKVKVKAGNLVKVINVTQQGMSQNI